MALLNRYPVPCRGKQRQASRWHRQPEPLQRSLIPLASGRQQAPVSAWAQQVQSPQQQRRQRYLEAGEHGGQQAEAVVQARLSA